LAAPHQCRLATSREAIDATTVRFTIAPPAAQQAVALEAVKCGVHRAFGQREGAGCTDSQLLDNGVPMCRAVGEDGKDQTVKVALESFWLHTLVVYT
jgi:hypothetical protein